jgi:hypothetical protein
MLTPESRARIEALNDEELAYEVQRGRESRFQREKYDYLKVLHAQRVQAKADAGAAETLEVAKAATRETRIGWIVALIVGVASVLAVVWVAR